MMYGVVSVKSLTVGASNLLRGPHMTRLALILDRGLTPGYPPTTRPRHTPGAPHASRNGRAFLNHNDRSNSSV